MHVSDQLLNCLKISSHCGKKWSNYVISIFKKLTFFRSLCLHATSSPQQPFMPRPLRWSIIVPSSRRYRFLYYCYKAVTVLKCQWHQTHQTHTNTSLARCDTIVMPLWWITKHLRGLRATSNSWAIWRDGVGKRTETVEVKDRNSEKTNRVVRNRGIRGEETGKWVNGLMGGKRPVWNRETKRGGGTILY